MAIKKEREIPISDQIGGWVHDMGIATFLLKPRTVRNTTEIVCSKINGCFFGATVENGWNPLEKRRPSGMAYNHEAPVLCCAFSKDGQRIFSGGCDNKAWITHSAGFWRPK